MRHTFRAHRRSFTILRRTSSFVLDSVRTVTVQAMGDEDHVLAIKDRDYIFPICHDLTMVFVGLSCAGEHVRLYFLKKLGDAGGEIGYSKGGLLAIVATGSQNLALCHVFWSEFDTEGDT